MNKEKRMDFIGIGLIAILTIIGMYLSVFAKSSFTGIGFIFGIVYFFLYKIINKRPFEEMHFSIRSVGKWLKQPKVWLLILAPAVINLAQTITAWLISRTFYTNAVRDELTRISSLIPGSMTSSFLVLIPYLLVLAMGEEICFRAFFQDRLSKYIPVAASLILSSIIFTIGHVYKEPLGIMIFWISNTFILSILFGVIQHKTKNAYISTISHFISNYLAFVLIYFLK